MNTFFLCSFILLTGAVVRVKGDCVIENPLICDPSAAQVVKKFTINSTCSDQVGQVLNLKEGETYEMNAEFVQDEDVEKAKSVAVLFAPGVGLITTDDQVCDKLDCPLQPNKTYNVKSMFAMKPGLLSAIARNANATLGWWLLNGKNQNVFCLRAQATMTKPTDAPLQFQSELSFTTDP